jgi:hypothetical protein
MKTYKLIKIIIAVFLTFSICPVFSQHNTANVQKEDKPQFKIGMYYNTTLNYYGRTDSLKSSGLFPVAEYWFNKNVYLNAAPVFVNNAVSGFLYAGTVISAGIQFGKENKNAGHIYFTKPVYKDNSELVQSALKAQLTGTYSWLTKLVNFTLGGDVKFSDKTDYGATAGLDHLFTINTGPGFLFAINPSININAGTQQFTKTYYKKSSILFFPGAEQQVTENVKKFNILSYECSVPVVVSKGKFQVIFSPAYVIPRNLIVVPNRPDLSERGENLFYTTLGFKVNF